MRAATVFGLLALLLLPARAADEQRPPVDLHERVSRAVLSLEADDLPLPDVLDLAATRAQVRIRVGDALAPRAGTIRITLQAKNVTLRLLLDVIAADHGLVWRIERDSVVIDERHENK